MKMNAALCLLMLCFSYAMAQSQLPELEEITEEMSQGYHSGVSVFLDNATPKIATQHWKDLLKKYGGKTKNNFLKKEYQSKVTIPSISGSNIEVFAQFKASPDSQAVTAIFWFDLGAEFIQADNYPDKYVGVVDLLTTYNQSVSIGIAEFSLKQEEKILKLYQREMSQMQKDNATYHKKMDEAKALIALMEKNIELNESAQVKKTAEIAEQEQIVDSAKGNVEKLVASNR